MMDADDSVMLGGRAHVCWTRAMTTLPHPRLEETYHQQRIFHIIRTSSIQVLTTAGVSTVLLLLPDTRTRNRAVLYRSGQVRYGR